VSQQRFPQVRESSRNRSRPTSSNGNCCARELTFLLPWQRLRTRPSREDRGKPTSTPSGGARPPRGAPRDVTAHTRTPAAAGADTTASCLGRSSSRWWPPGLTSAALLPFPASRNELRFAYIFTAASILASLPPGPHRRRAAALPRPRAPGRGLPRTNPAAEDQGARGETMISSTFRSAGVPLPPAGVRCGSL